MLALLGTAGLTTGLLSEKILAQADKIYLQLAVLIPAVNQTLTF
jgi:hypothetical protein